MAVRCQIGWLTDSLTGLSDCIFVKRYLRNYNRSEVEAVQVGRVLWQADGPSYLSGLEIKFKVATRSRDPVDPDAQTYFPNSIELLEVSKSNLSM